MKSAIARLSLFLVVILSCASATLAKDDWIRVRSKNFLLIGNASEKEIRNVAERLELFRSALTLLFDSSNLSSPVATNVVVFRDEITYTPYKPLKRDGKVDASVQGYFKAGQDVNYITVTIGHDEEASYRTVFHEYVHFVVSTLYPRSEVPSWFNEGLAEYYSTFTAPNGQTAEIGAPIKQHVKLLKESPLVPLDTLLTLRNTEIQNGDTPERSLFYAESWAFVHYLIETGRNGEMRNFVQQTINGTPIKQAFGNAFRQEYASVETPFRAYLAKGDFRTGRVAHISTAAGSSLVVNHISPGSTSAYLGDLLYHLDRPDEAELLLMAALRDDPTIDIANADLGMIRFHQQRFDEAYKYLEMAARAENTSASILYRYAYVLSRQGFDDSGNITDYTASTITKVRGALHRAIATEPAMTESYDLLAVIDLAADENLDEAADAMQRALHYEPGRNDYALRLADVYVRQNKYDEASSIADRVARDGAANLQKRATAIQDYIREQQDYKKRIADQTSLRERGEIVPLGPRTDPPMTHEEIDAANALATLRSINSDLRIPAPGEERAIGTIQHIDCSQAKIRFILRSDDHDITLSTTDFQRLILRTFDKAAAGVQIGCETQMNARMAVVTYKQHSSGGEIVAIEFVPSNFRLLTSDEMLQPRAHLVREDQVDSDGYSLKDRSPRATLDLAKSEPDNSRLAILAALGKPSEGEKRDVGYLQGIECGTDFYFLLRTATATLRLKNISPKTLHARSFVRSVPDIEFTCSTAATDYPLVITYRPSSAGAGSVVSLALVPQDFKLD